MTRPGPDRDVTVHETAPRLAPEGVSDRRPAAELGPRAAMIRDAVTLGELAREFALVHWHALVLHAGLDPEAQDPLDDWAATVPGAECFQLGLRDPVVAGLAGGRPHAFEAVLELVPAPLWPSLKDRLRGVAVLDPVRRRYARAALQRVRFPDVRALRTVRGAAAAAVPTVDGWAVGVDATDRHLLFAAPAAASAAAGDLRPRLVRLAPSAPTRALGAALLAGLDRPFAAVDPASVAAPDDETLTRLLRQAPDRVAARLGGPRTGS